MRRAYERYAGLEDIIAARVKWQDCLCGKEIERRNSAAGFAEDRSI